MRDDRAVDHHHRQRRPVLAVDDVLRRVVERDVVEAVHPQHDQVGLLAGLQRAGLGVEHGRAGASMVAARRMSAADSHCA
jgi:hypothetical protein